MQGRRHAPQVVRQGHGHYLPPAQLHAGLPGHQQQQQQHGQHEQHHGHGHGHHGQPHHQAAVAAPAPGAARHLTSTTFASLPLSPSSQRALAEVLRFTHLTEVQNATLPAVSAWWACFSRLLRRPNARAAGKLFRNVCPRIDIWYRWRLCPLKDGMNCWMVQNSCMLISHACMLPMAASEKASTPTWSLQVLAGGDVMARAKTGTGKTMAFLIPAIEALVR